VIRYLTSTNIKRKEKKKASYKNNIEEKREEKRGIQGRESACDFLVVQKRERIGKVMLAKRICILIGGGFRSRKRPLRMVTELDR